LVLLKAKISNGEDAGLEPCVCGRVK